MISAIFIRFGAIVKMFREGLNMPPPLSNPRHRSIRSKRGLSLFHH